jgi:hypothetical protein
VSWSPRNNIIDLDKIVENLFAFMTTNQTDAILWANNNVALTAFAKLYPSARGRLSTVFPCLMLLKKNIVTDFSGDLVQASISLIFEAQIQGGNVDVIVEKAEKYAKAVESMLINIPMKDLTNGALNLQSGDIENIETEYDLLRSNKGNTVYLQVFQTQIEYIIYGAAFA